MKTYALLFPLVSAVAVLAGCAAKPKPIPAPMAPTAEQASAIRETFTKAIATARTGLVSAVASDLSYASVTDINVEGLKVGDAISFVDGSKTTVAHGTIVEIKGSLVAVQYQAATRAPVVGDVAVKF